MRTIALLISIATLELAAQDPLRIWGLTPNGGANDKGTVFRVDADGSNFVTVFDFTDESGWGPEGGLCLAPNGLLYGLTTFGGEGAPAAGTLFTIDPADGTFNKLRDFNLGNGGFNWSTLITGTDGLLYGAGYAGSDGGGSIYRVDPTTNEYTELYALDQATDGGAITGRLLQAADGLFYGTASQGGASGEAGTIFRYNAVTDLFTKLHDFDSALGGRTPYGGVCEAGNGWFYGTTYTGGLSDRGIIYKYNAVTDEFVKIHDMVEDDGSNCWNTLLRLGPDLLIGGVANGSLISGGYRHGSAQYGCGHRGLERIASQRCQSHGGPGGWTRRTDLRPALARWKRVLRHPQPLLPDHLPTHGAAQFHQRCRWWPSARRTAGEQCRCGRR
ncbi:MAG: hypothetical protein IPK99_16160 [Flavobacteriales bacterium]|nr:hypothetical protein [Flavobacteriales bacterium]